MEHIPRGAVDQLEFRAQVASSDSEALAADRLAPQTFGTDLARETNGQIQPRYLYIPRLAGRLACTDLAIEPALGLVRVAGVLPLRTENGDRSAYVRITWADDIGSSRASGRYPAEQAFAVRVPDYADRLLIRQGVEQAKWQDRPVTSAIVRLIAAHLHLGPHSAVYGFAVSGAVTDQLYEELDQVSTSQPAYRSWAATLARYCLSREDIGPLAGWGPSAPNTKAGSARGSASKRRWGSTAG